MKQFCTFALPGLLAAGVMLAQEPLAVPGPGAAQVDASASSQLTGDRDRNIEKRLAHMTRRYKLTADQQTQIRSILEKEQRDVQLVHADTFMSRSNRREETVSVQEASQKKIAAILTDRQRHKFDAEEKRRAWMDGRLPEPNPGPPLN
jgi:Spy/CpxP family protein refolding chaperone